jgi:hypothetical protein
MDAFYEVAKEHMPRDTVLKVEEERLLITNENKSLFRLKTVLDGAIAMYQYYFYREMIVWKQVSRNRLELIRMYR